MPYKDKEARAEAVKRHRDYKKGLQSGGITDEKQPQMLSRPNRMGSDGLPEFVPNEYNPNELLPDGRKRYLGPFSDGQVLDRTTVPEAKHYAIK